MGMSSEAFIIVEIEGAEVLYVGMDGEVRVDRDRFPEVAAGLAEQWRSDA
jgi:hypothetical protein